MTDILGRDTTVAEHHIEHEAAEYRPARALPDQPEWYKRAVFYEVLVRAFFDSNGDGTGDMRGLIDKLDYLTGWGSTASGFRPSTTRRCGTADTTSATTARCCRNSGRCRISPT